MQQHTLKRGAVLMVVVMAAWVGGWVTPASAAKARVEVTGQTTSFAEGDDGEIQAGVPFPKPRFRDKGNGAVVDKLTGLIWLKDANCFGQRTWFAALGAVNALSDTGTPETTDDCDLSDGSQVGDWRLPNVKELQSLIHFGFAVPALSNAEGTGQWTEGDAFSGVQAAAYWSSTSFTNIGAHWIVILDAGMTGGSLGPPPHFVWPVRGENSRHFRC
jgi:hypothetical protein